MIKQRLYNKYKQLQDRKLSLEVRQFVVENHLENHPTDYVSVIANERLKSTISHLEYLIEEIIRRLEVGR